MVPRDRGANIHTQLSLRTCNRLCSVHWSKSFNRLCLRALEPRKRACACRRQDQQRLPSSESSAHAHGRSGGDLQLRDAEVAELHRSLRFAGAGDRMHSQKQRRADGGVPDTTCARTAPGRHYDTKKRRQTSEIGLFATAQMEALRIPRMIGCSRGTRTGWTSRCWLSAPSKQARGRGGGAPLHRATRQPRLQQQGVGQNTQPTANRQHDILRGFVDVADKLPQLQLAAAHEVGVLVVE